MKVALFIGFFLIIIPHRVSSSDEVTKDVVVNPSRREILLHTVVRRLHKMWIENSDKSNSVVGRCLGLARKIKAILPVAVFMMGVIMTKLGFLTLFSMKTLGLVGLLLLLNTSGAVAKITAAFLHKEEKHPQTVHFHVHKDDDHDHHPYHIGHSGPGLEWDRTSRYPDDDLNKIDTYNLYNKLLKSLAIKNKNTIY